MAKLQLALDFLDFDDALGIVERSLPSLDIVEVGTPLLLREGMRAVRELAARFAGVSILADTKIVDGGYGEALSAFDAGARYATVLAVAAPETLRSARRAAAERGGELVADLIAARDPLEAAAAAVGCGIAGLCVHRSTDAGSWGRREAQLVEELRRRYSNLRITIAGGLTVETLPRALTLLPDVIVVGRSITETEDPGAAAREIRRIISAEVAP